MRNFHDTDRDGNDERTPWSPLGPWDRGSRGPRRGRRGPGGFGPGGFGPGFVPGFGPPPGGPGFGPPPGRRRRNRGDVRAAVLRVLADGPMHGYQIIQELTARSGGVWRPSPGAVYPTLSQLEDEGLVTGRQDEGRNVFELTDTGRTEAERVSQDPRAPWATDDDLVNLHEQFEQLAGAIGQVARAGSPAQRAEATRLVTEARRAVYRILAEDDQPAAGESQPANEAEGTTA